MKRTNRFQKSLWELGVRVGTAPSAPSTIAKTDIPALDAAVGGIAIGQIAALVGVPSVGVTTLAYRLCAGIQRDEKAHAVYIDVGRSFDADAAHRCGIRFDRLLLVRPKSAQSGLEIAFDLVKASGVRLVVLDGIVPDRTALTRLKAAIAGSHLLIVMTLNALPVDTSAFGTVLALRRLAWLNDGDSIEGWRVCAVLVKVNGRLDGREVEFDIRVDDDGDDS